MLFDRNAKYAFLAAAVTLAGLRLGFGYAVEAANAFLEKRPVLLRAQLTTIPLRLGNWRAEGEGPPLTAEIVEELGTDRYIDRAYRRGEARPTAPVMSLHITYYTGLIDAVPHVPDRCLVAGGLIKKTRPKNLPLNVGDSEWQIDSAHVNRRTGKPYPVLTYHDRVTGKPMRVRMPIGEFELRTTEFSSEERPELRVRDVLVGEDGPAVSAAGLRCTPSSGGDAHAMSDFSSDSASLPPPAKTPHV